MRDDERRGRALSSGTGGLVAVEDFLDPGSGLSHDALAIPAHDSSPVFGISRVAVVCQKKEFCLE
jgi:hypothetical protein